MIILWSLFVMLSVAPSIAVATTPAEGVVLAAQDVGSLPGDVRPHTRYLVFQDAGELPVLNGHLNLLSRSSEIVQAAVVGGKVLRVNLLDYGWDPKVWETLEASDPYYHADLEVSRKRVRGLAPILSEGVVEQVVNGEKVYHNVTKNLAYLVQETQSKTPIVRADWFFNQTAAAADRSPNYYDFLAVKNEKDFQRLIGFDAKLAKDYGRILRESVSISGVTHQPRAIEIQKSIGGWYLKTYDFAKAVGAKNPLRVLGDDISKVADATEQYGPLPNGLWATFLADGNGVRQDSAPDKIASDSMSRSTDKRVHINVSCVRCHTNGGLQPIDGFFRNFAREGFAIGSPDYQKHLEVRREYMKSLQGSLDTARLLYEEAIKEASGVDSKAFASKYAAYWERYEDARIDLAWAAKDLGLKSESLKALIETRVKAGIVDPTRGGVDLVMASWVRGSHIGVRQYEEVFQLIHIVLRGDRP